MKKSSSLPSAIKFTLTILILITLFMGTWYICNERACYVVYAKWSIPNVDVAVDCYRSHKQSVADRENSANYMRWGDCHIVADHNYQGFEKIKACKVGDVAHLEIKGKVTSYECVGITTGINTGVELYEDSGRDLRSHTNTGGITCYTCNEDCEHITIVHFQKISS